MCCVPQIRLPDSDTVIPAVPIELYSVPLGVWAVEDAVPLARAARAYTPTTWSFPKARLDLLAGVIEAAEGPAFGFRALPTISSYDRRELGQAVIAVCERPTYLRVVDLLRQAAKVGEAAAVAERDRVVATGATSRAQTTVEQEAEREAWFARRGAWLRAHPDHLVADLRLIPAAAYPIVPQLAAAAPELPTRRLRVGYATPTLPLRDGVAGSWWFAMDATVRSGQQAFREAVAAWAADPDTRQEALDTSYPINWGDAVERIPAEHWARFGLHPLPDPTFDESFLLDVDEVILDHR